MLLAVFDWEENISKDMEILFSIPLNHILWTYLPASTMGHGNAMAAWPIMIKTIDHSVDCVCYKIAKKKYNMFWPVFWPVLLNWVLGKMKNEKHDEFYTTKNLPNHWLLFICLLYFCRYIFSTLQTIGVFQLIFQERYRGTKK